VKDRRLDHLGHVGAIECRARVQRFASGETNLIVDDDVYRATGRVPARLG
jgi:hypothetical protein